MTYYQGQPNHIIIYEESIQSIIEPLTSIIIPEFATYKATYLIVAKIINKFDKTELTELLVNDECYKVGKIVFTEKYGKVYKSFMCAYNAYLIGNINYTGEYTDRHNDGTNYASGRIEKGKQIGVWNYDHGCYRKEIKFNDNDNFFVVMREEYDV